MGGQVQRIRHPSQLAALRAWHLFPPRSRDRLAIDAQGSSAEHIRSWERQLNGLRSACGCEQGALGLIVGLVGYGLFLLLRSGGWGHPGRKELWLGLGVVVATTSAGKLLGLVVAQLRLKRVIAEIQAQWRPQQGQDEGPARTEPKRSHGQVRATRCCGDRSAAPLQEPAGRQGA